MTLKQAAQAILDELNNRYDGAPDSHTLWMGEHVDHLADAIAQGEEVERNFATLRATMAPFKDLSVFLTRTLSHHTHTHGTLCYEWRASVVCGEYCEGESDTDFDKALARLLVTVQKRPPVCPTCGGTFHPSCKHYAGDERDQT